MIYQCNSCLQAASHESEGYPCDLSNHQDRVRTSYYEEKMTAVKHPYLHINGQDYDQATLSGKRQCVITLIT